MYNRSCGELAVLQVYAKWSDRHHFQGDVPRCFHCAEKSLRRWFSWLEKYATLVHRSGNHNLHCSRLVGTAIRTEPVREKYAKKPRHVPMVVENCGAMEFADKGAISFHQQFIDGAALDAEDTPYQILVGCKKEEALQSKRYDNVRYNRFIKKYGIILCGMFLLSWSVRCFRKDGEALKKVMEVLWSEGKG
jgi:hypothetical protein